MDMQSLDDFETINIPSTDQTHSANLNSKLERRRRIEELNEERQLQKELNDFY